MVAVRNAEIHDEAVESVHEHEHEHEARASLPALRLVPACRRPTEAVYRRRRLLVGTVVGLVSVAALRVAGPALGDPADAPLEAGGVHVVEPGDTYWSIASSLDDDGDIRDTVDALTAANGSLALQVGDRLSLPG